MAGIDLMHNQDAEKCQDQDQDQDHHGRHSSSTMSVEGRFPEQHGTDLETNGPQAGLGASGPMRPRLEDRSTTLKLSKVKTLPALKREETKLMQKEAHPGDNWALSLGLPAIIIFDLVVPCAIYYSWYNSHKSSREKDCQEQTLSREHECSLDKQFDSDILGYAIISFGFGELWILIARCWRLFMRTEACAPLLSRSKWELDATSWVYLTAMLVALVPFVVGSSLTMPHLYLYGPSFLMGFLGVLMIVTTCLPFNIPIGINSHARGTGLRPFIYYAAEDFIAVDGLQDKEFRVRYNDRYEQNKAFRKMFLILTWWWIVGICIYVGCVSMVIWLCEFHIAFGLSFGVLFSYIAIWAGMSALYVKWEIARQHRAFEAGDMEDFVPLSE